MSPRDKRRLVRAVNRRGESTQVPTERRNLRVEFEASGTVVVKLGAMGGGEVHHAVLPRNLSRRGMAFLHGRFVYPDTECEVMMPTVQDGAPLAIPAKVARCRHVAGIVHEVSLVFDQVIDLSMFVPLSRDQAALLEQEMEVDSLTSDGVGGGGLAGRALIITSFKADSQLYRFWLKKLDIVGTEPTDLQQVLKDVREHHFDLALVDLQLGGSSGTDLIRKMRKVGFASPIIALSADEDAGTQDQAMDAGCSSFLPKPFTCRLLQMVVEDLLMLDGTGQGRNPIVSNLAADPDMRPLIRKFVNELGEQRNQLSRAAADQDHATLRHICQHLKGAGTSYGLAPVTAMARLVLESMDETENNLDAIRRTVNELVGTLRRVKMD